MESATRNRPRLAGAALGAVRCGLTALLVCAASTSAGVAAAQSPDLPGMVRLTIEVELSCPSCATGLERRLRRLEHVAGVEVRPSDGQIVLAVEPGFAVAFAALAGFVVGGIVPEYALRMRITRRAQAMGAALPDALDLTVMGLESGLTFERTLLTVAEELRPIEANLAHELGLMEAELRVGAERRAVLEAFQQRSLVEGLRDLSMTLIQSERFGTPLTQSMKNISAQERTQRAMRIEAAAQRLPVMMTLPMLIFVVPGTICLVAGPAFLAAIQALGAFGGG